MKEVENQQFFHNKCCIISIGDVHTLRQLIQLMTSFPQLRHGNKLPSHLRTVNLRLASQPFRPNSPYPRAQFTEQTNPRFRGGAPRGKDNNQPDHRLNPHKQLVVPNADIFRIYIPTTVRQSIRLAAYAGKEDTSQLCVEVEPHNRALEHSNVNEGADRVQPTHAAA